MAAAGEKTLAHSRDHVTNLSTESRNLFKMAAPLLSPKRELLQTVRAAYFILGISRTDLQPRVFFEDTLELLPSEIQLKSFRIDQG